MAGYLRTIAAAGNSAIFGRLGGRGRGGQVFLLSYAALDLRLVL